MTRLTFRWPLVFVMLCGSAIAADLDPALVEKAEKGDSTAQYFLGAMYAKGEGVPKDNAEAVKWFRKAAEQGHTDAQYILG